MALLKRIAERLTHGGLENGECRSHAIKTMKHILKRSPWALKMIDSSSKFPSGVLMGNIIDFGNYDECLKVDVKEDWGSFVGQHCMVKVPMKSANIFLNKLNYTDHLSWMWSMCIPSSCSPGDLSRFLSDTLMRNVTVVTCHTNSSKPLETIEWFGIAVLSFFGILCLLSTVYDLFVTDKSHRNDALVSFSWYTNGKRLLSTDTSENSMDCLNGIRLISMMWIVLSHSYFYGPPEPAVNIVDFPEKLRDWYHVFLTSGFHAVDTFLLLSGLLLSHIFFKAMSKEARFNLFHFYFHRYIRLTPMLAVTALIYAGLQNRFASGPLWDYSISSIQKSCQENWWATILYVHNYVTPEDMCVRVSWYLAVDMQLYLLSPLVLFPLLRRPRLGFIWLQILTVISIISCFLSLYLAGVNITIVHVWQTPTFNYAYTHARATPWLIGITLGYILFRNHQWRKDISKGICHGHSKMMVFIGWLLATICFIITIVIRHRLVQTDTVPNVAVDGLHTALSRLFWPLGVAWVIYACVVGCGGAVNTFLSWTFFKPLSRVTFGIYLIHGTTIWIQKFSTRVPVHLSDQYKITFFLSQMVMVVPLAAVATLMFESPIMFLEKFMVQKVSENKLGRTKNY